MFLFIFCKFLFVLTATGVQFIVVCFGCFYEKVSLYKDAFVWKNCLDTDQ